MTPVSPSHLSPYRRFPLRRAGFPALTVALLAAPVMFGITLAAAEEAKPPNLTFSNWTKVCFTSDRACTTSKDGRLDSGTVGVAAALIEPRGGKRILRVTLPLGMQIKHGTRVIIDQGQPLAAPYVNCFADGCQADYEASNELISKMRSGKGLAVQSINGAGKPMNLVIPLADFASAYGGAPTMQQSDQSKPKPATALTERDQFIFSPWTKFCLKGTEANAKNVCFTGKDGRIESGVPVVAAVLIEPEGEPNKLLRVTLPPGVSIEKGTRVIVDQGQALTAPYVVCFNNGCMADYAASGELISRMKRGQSLAIQGISADGQPITMAMPLADFAKAHDGPPTDPKVFEAQQKRLQDELQRRAEDARNRPADRPVVAAAPPTPPATAPAATASANPGRRVALVIGNSSYAAVPALPNPKHDAEAVAAALREVGFQSVTMVDDASREAMVKALAAFGREADNADWALVYYAGHGIEVGGTNYLIPVDARLASNRDVSIEAVSLDQIMTHVEGARKLRVVMLDACRENPFIAKMARRDASRSVGRGLARYEPAAGSIVVYAAREGQIAIDGDAKNSPFAAAFLKNLRTPNLDVRRMFDLVRDDVMEATGQHQQPFAYSSVSGREEFYFLAGQR
jgi:invasion protein IalB